jgi:hypothetical protein
MTRIAILVGLGLSLAACNKPAAEDCRKALTNIQRILHTENLMNTAQFEGEVRRCKGGSSKEAVECAIKAQNKAELDKCGYNSSDDDSSK